METHDPICGSPDMVRRDDPGCLCGLIAMVRADERERVSAIADLSFLDALTTREELENLRSDLRAKVEALPEGAERRWDGDDALIWRSDVLDLIGGGGDV